MDSIMRGEAPLFTRCCFCIPLRRGLIGWGYVRLAFNIMAIVYLIIVMTWIVRYVGLNHLTGFMGMIVFIMIDVAFTVLLIFAGHTKNSKLLRISYIFSIVWVIIVLAFTVYSLIGRIVLIFKYWDLYSTNGFFITEVSADLAFTFTAVFIQIYVIMLIRSEVIKLQNQSLAMQFVNNAAEAEARCVSTEQRCTDNGHASVQDTDDAHDTSVQDMGNGHDSPVQFEPIGYENKRYMVLDLLAMSRLLWKAMTFFEHYAFDTLFMISFTFFFIDAVFSLLLIVAGYKKKPKLLRISIIYSTIWLILVVVLGGFIFNYEIDRLIAWWHENPYVILDLFACCGFIFTVIFVQLYVILMTRSEEIKLRNQNLEMQFVNNAANEESCFICTDNGHDTSARYTNDGHETCAQCTEKGHGTSV